MEDSQNPFTGTPYPLIEVAKTGDVAALNAILESTSDLTVCDKKGRTALHWAAREGNTPVLHKLLEIGGLEVNTVDKQKWTSLHYASYNNHPDCVSLLLKFGADLHLKTTNQRTPLELAKFNNSTQAIEVLSNHTESSIYDQINESLNGIVPDLEELPAEQRDELNKRIEKIKQRAHNLQQSEAKVNKIVKTQKERKLVIKRIEERLRQKDKTYKEREREIIKREQARTKWNENNQLDVMDIAVCNISWDELQLQEVLGEGTFAIVYSALWKGDLVAVKRIKGVEEGNTSIVKDFTRETFLLSQMRHRNIVLLMAACRDPPYLCIVTELMEGGDLHALLHSEERIPWAERLRFGLDISRGVNYLHQLMPPVVHRDLKSHNILLDATGRAKICDMGLTRVREQTLIRTKNAAGTPAYMSPECLRGEDFDEKSDAFSFGVILWELLTRQTPWEGKSALDVISRVGFNEESLPLPLVPPPGCPEEFLEIARQCISGNDFERPTFCTIVDTFFGLTEANGTETSDSDSG